MPVRVGLVCVGAGRGRRFGADKLAAVIAGRSVLELALAALKAAFEHAPLVVVVAPDRVDRWKRRLGARFPGSLWLGGGERRQDSVRTGVEAAAAVGCSVVCVHDAARPLVRPEDVQAVVAALGDADCAILCQRVADTVKRVDGQEFVVETVPRDQLRLALTPQVFRVDRYERAWRDLGRDGSWSDEAALLEAAGRRVVAVEAVHPNPKLTVPADLQFLRVLAARLFAQGGRGGGR